MKRGAKLNIIEYYKMYPTNKYDLDLFKGSADTIEDFYINCIKKTMLDYKYIMKWHKMLLEYVNRDDAIYWIRKFESGEKNELGRWNTRRATITKFLDGFTYVFVSNYDVHEIFNMIYKKIEVPTAAEFAKIMKNRKIPLHYDNGNTKSCEEADIAAFPHIGNVRCGLLTQKGWYLAHIHGINQEKYIKSNGEVVTKSEIEYIFPRGNIKDWNNKDGYFIRNLNYTLNNDEKEIVKAHFLRFIDPLNYFIVPGKKYEQHNIRFSNKNGIGEYNKLIIYMQNQYLKIFRKENNGRIL